nr:methyl-accepting chemotaxis protein [uncultured Desulfobulbus sp.]
MLNNLKIGTRLSCGFGVLLVLMVLVGGYSIKKIHALDDEIEILVNNRMVKLEQANQLIDNVNLVARAVRNLLLIDNDHNREALEHQRIAEASEKNTRILEEFDKTIKLEKGRDLLTKMATEIRPVYIRQLDSLLELVKGEREQEAKTLLMGDYRQIQAEYFKALYAFTDYQSEMAKNAGKEAGQGAATATRVIPMLLVAALGLSALLAFLIVRSITVPIYTCAAFMQMMAQNDFSMDVPEQFRGRRDEFGALANANQAMVNNTRQLLKDTMEGVQMVATSSNDLAAVSRQLTAAAKDTADKSGSVAAATEEVSTNMQSVSAAMEQSTSNVNMVASSTEEMTSTVGEIAQSAEKARAITEGAVTQSRLTSEKMTDLGEAARKIGRVTETITEISEQTNLLALNATIEAARAGDAGKGFAVVANEIKELARQTAEATIDIKSQIGEMQTTTSTTVEDIEKISTIIVEINSVINGIATAVEEQSAATNEIAGNIAQASQGIAEVNENVAQSTVVITDITSDIASINQQSAQVGDGSGQVQNSAQGLAQLAAELEQLVKQFKV